MLRVDDRWWDETKDARGFHRVPADVAAELTSTALGRVRATVLDLSQGGCRIRTPARCRTGDRFVLKVGSIEPKAVTVMWNHDDEAGLRFTIPLSWSIVAQLSRVVAEEGLEPPTRGL